MDTWFECSECIFATNSPKQAIAHEDKTGHEVYDESGQPE